MKPAIMNKTHFRGMSTALAAVTAILLAAPQLLAQGTQQAIRPSSGANGTGTFSSRSTAGGGGGSTSCTRQYPDATMIESAMIQVWEESRPVVIAADDDTKAQIMKVLDPLDKPKPPAIIK